MRASIREDGMTSRLRCDLVMTAGLDRMEESVVDPHTGGSDAETTTDSAARIYQFSSLMMHYRYSITDDERHIIM